MNTFAVTGAYPQFSFHPIVLQRSIIELLQRHHFNGHVPCKIINTQIHQQRECKMEGHLLCGWNMLQIIFFWENCQMIQGHILSLFLSSRPTRATFPETFLAASQEMSKLGDLQRGQWNVFNCRFSLSSQGKPVNSWFIPACFAKTSMVSSWKKPHSGG